MAFLKKKLSKKEKETEAHTADKVSRGSMQGGNVGSVGVLLYPHITEKTAAAVGRRVYTFVVASKTNKVEIKKAIENKYGVKVTGIRVVVIPGKEIRRGKQIGWKQGIKKAYTTLAEGQTIEVQ